MNVLTLVTKQMLCSGTKQNRCLCLRVFLLVYDCEWGTEDIFNCCTNVTQTLVYFCFFKVDQATFVNVSVCFCLSCIGLMNLCALNFSKCSSMFLVFEHLPCDLIFYQPLVSLCVC